MNKYTILLHMWWMDTRGWEEHNIEAENKKAAIIMAKALCLDKIATFQHCDYYVLPRGDQSCP